VAGGRPSAGMWGQGHLASASVAEGVRSVAGLVAGATVAASRRPGVEGVCLGSRPGPRPSARGMPVTTHHDFSVWCLKEKKACQGTGFRSWCGT
jgi:hypothetical protein